MFSPLMTNTKNTKTPVKMRVKPPAVLIVHHSRPGEMKFKRQSLNPEHRTSEMDPKPPMVLQDGQSPEEDQFVD